MNSRSRYRTRQREILVGYFESRPGHHITAGDVCEYCKEQGVSVGQSTVYRQLESLVDEGIINKYIIDGNSPACFEFAGKHEDETQICFHCKCEKCGKLIHLHCDELEEIQRHLREEHGFLMDPRRTVFYGICESCQQEVPGSEPEPVSR